MRGRTSTVARRDPGGQWWDGADVVALAVTAPGEGGNGPVAVGRPARAVLARYGVDLAALAGTERIGTRAGDVFRVPVAAPDGMPPRLLLVGAGDGGARDLRRAGAGLARAVRGRGRAVTTLGAGSGGRGTQAVVEGLVLGGYAPPSNGTRSREDSAPAGRVELVGDHERADVDRARVAADATVLARSLAETPSDVKTPAWMARQATTVARRYGLGVRVWNADELTGQGFGGLAAVGRGSESPPRLVQLDHPGDGSGRGRVVLVGKGITYDTGGISIKPREAMVPMKTDMSGSAAVLAAVAGCAALDVRRPVTALMPLAENAFGAASYRPGDVVTLYGGTTVEIGNTDAEGRLVLADALAYADTHLDPEILVDIATLTGAATLGLGRRHAALYATDDRLAAGLDRAGQETGEQVWRMPLVEDYHRAVVSELADLRQVAPDGFGGGGSITAALFLREFTGGRRWAHLDIAGPARSDRDEHEVTKGATGFGARLLLRWLEGLR
jgi:leucyl aminopeptidase